MNFKEYSLTLIPPWRRLLNSSTLASLYSLGKNLTRKALLKISSHGTTYLSPTILPIIIPYSSHVLKLINNKSSLLSSTHPHRKQNNVDLIKEILWVFIAIRSKVHGRINSHIISQTAIHSTSILVLLRWNLSVSLYCDGLILSGDILGYLEQDFPHLTIRHSKRIHRKLIICNNLHFRRNLIARRSSSCIHNLLSYSSCVCHSCPHCL